jgi:hypothetical protein
MHASSSAPARPLPPHILSDSRSVCSIISISVFNLDGYWTGKVAAVYKNHYFPRWHLVYSKFLDSAPTRRLKQLMAH